MTAPERPGPLARLRVIETGQLIAGPFCGQLLGDFGAEVIKIEPPGSGDPLRSWRRMKGDGPSLWWPIIARNKKSITLDLRQTAGQELARRLIVNADVLIENFRPGTMEKWNLGYEALAAANPRLVMARMSGFGQTGPYSQQPGFGSIGEAMGGLRYVTGYPDRPPSRVGISIGDSLTALFGALGVLAALLARETSGRGQMVDAALYESVLAIMECLVTEFQQTGQVRERSGATLPGVAPSNVYACADGISVVIGANGNGVFARLCQAMAQPELASQGRFDTDEKRGALQKELDRIISDWTAQLSSASVLALMRQFAIPAGLIYRAPEMLADPHFAERSALIDVRDALLGTIKMQGVFPRLSATPGEVRWSGPALGQHNEEIYRGLLGVSEAELEDLRQSKVI
ncbi:MAG: CoA transferase [Gammaproteobacteria bacterium]|jgi:formyl-CoA transferase|nr:CoA transferase [Gammaproteobacteria bacterium]